MVSYLPEKHSSKNDIKKWEVEFKGKVFFFLMEKQTLVMMLIGFYRTEKIEGIKKNIW